MGGESAVTTALGWSGWGAAKGVRSSTSPGTSDHEEPKGLTSWPSCWAWLWAESCQPGAFPDERLPQQRKAVSLPSSFFASWVHPSPGQAENCTLYSTPLVTWQPWGVSAMFLDFRESAEAEQGTAAHSGGLSSQTPAAQPARGSLELSFFPRPWTSPQHELFLLQRYQ